MIIFTGDTTATYMIEVPARPHIQLAISFYS